MIIPLFSVCCHMIIMMLRYRIVPYFVLSQSSKTFAIRSFFFEKNGYLLMFLAGPKFRNLPASKLASDFRPFDPDILSCSGLFYNLSYTHVVHIYQHLYLIFSTFYRTLFTPEAYSATSSSVSFSAFLHSPSENTSPPHKKTPSRLIHFPAEIPGAW